MSKIPSLTIRDITELITEDHDIRITKNMQTVKLEGVKTTFFVAVHIKNVLTTGIQ